MSSDMQNMAYKIYIRREWNAIFFIVQVENSYFNINVQITHASEHLFQEEIHSSKQDTRFHSPEEQLNILWFGHLYHSFHFLCAK